MSAETMVLFAGLVVLLLAKLTLLIADETRRPRARQPQKAAPGGGIGLATRS